MYGLIWPKASNQSLINVDEQTLYILKVQQRVKSNPKIVIVSGSKSPSFRRPIASSDRETVKNF
jgi:hypothetical protein